MKIQCSQKISNKQVNFFKNYKMVKRVSVKYTVNEICKIIFPVLSKLNIISKLKTGLILNNV